VPGLRFSFDDTGRLHGEFTCEDGHQGYDGMVHGGVIAAITDASMAQCLMGHDIVAYTADLTIKYRKPVKTHQPTVLTTHIETVNVGMLYTMSCEITQNRTLVAEAKARFIKVK